MGIPWAAVHAAGTVVVPARDRCAFAGLTRPSPVKSPSSVAREEAVARQEAELARQQEARFERVLSHVAAKENLEGAPIEIASGGQGKIFALTKSKDGDTIVKVAFATSDGALPGSMEREAEVFAAVENGRHPGKRFVLPVKYIQTPDGPALRSDRMRGSLVEETGRTQPSAALEVGLQTLQGLDAIHAAGWVHRDIKPDNLLRAPTGEIRIADAGVATALGAEPVTHAGTPLYMELKLLDEGEPRSHLKRDVFATLRTIEELLPRNYEWEEGVNAFTAPSSDRKTAQVLHPMYSAYTRYEMERERTGAPKLPEKEDRIFRMLSSLHQARSTFATTGEVRALLEQAQKVESKADLDRWYAAYFEHLGQNSTASHAEVANILFSDSTAAEYFSAKPTGFPPATLYAIRNSLRKELDASPDAAWARAHSTSAFRIPEAVRRALEAPGAN